MQNFGRKMVQNFGQKIVAKIGWKLLQKLSKSCCKVRSKKLQNSAEKRVQNWPKKGCKIRPGKWCKILSKKLKVRPGKCCKNWPGHSCDQFYLLWTLRAVSIGYNFTNFEPECRQRHQRKASTFVGMPRSFSTDRETCPSIGTTWCTSSWRRSGPHGLP